MEADENNDKCCDQDFLLLLAKRRKLLDLREDVLARSQRQVNTGKINLDSPDSPATPASITPPPFSPLTPFVTKTINKEGGKEFWESNPDTALSHMLSDINIDSSIQTPLLLRNIDKEEYSPLPAMSPETQKLFKVLTETDSIFDSNASDVIENSDIDQDNNDDVSVADPDFDVNLENESETDCESYSGNEYILKKKTINKGEKNKSGNKIQKTEMTLVVEKDIFGKKATNWIGPKRVTQNKDLHETPTKWSKKDNDNNITNFEVLKISNEKEISNNKEDRRVTSSMDKEEILRSTPGKRPRNENSLSSPSKNKKIIEFQNASEKKAKNNNEPKSDTLFNDQNGMFKTWPKKSTSTENKNVSSITDLSTEKKIINKKEYRAIMSPKRNIACDNTVVNTKTNLEVLQTVLFIPEKERGKSKEHTTTIISSKDDDRKKDKTTRQGNSDIPPYFEHRTPKTTPKKSTGYEEKDSPVINLECLEILTLTPEKEINNEENVSVTPHKNENEILISPPVTKTITEGNNNLLPTIQILERGSMSPDNVINNEENRSVAPLTDVDEILISTPVTTPRLEGNNNLSKQINEIESILCENVVESNTIGNNVVVALTSEMNTGRPKKGRKRKHPQTNSERKFNKYNNLQYTTLHKQKEIEPKSFVAFECKCLKQCHRVVSNHTRKQEFEKFVKLGSYNAQLLYILSCVKEEKKKRSYTMTSVPADKKKPKQFHRTYTIKGVQVCRDMFLNTFQITTQKVTITLKKMRNNTIDDCRGLARSGWSKLPEYHFNFIVEVISQLPKYESHYSRVKSNNALYLEPGMTLPKMYEIYKKMFTEKFGTEQKCASFECVKKIFLNKFNLRCKTLKKDTCNKCDLFAVQLQNAKSLTEKKQIEAEKLAHQEKAETMRNQMKSDFKNAQENENIECLTFDLEKTLPLPRIPTNVVFYKRQLWFYNSGIHSASDDVGHCYCWVEGEAGRGAQEVGSCLIKYIETKLRHTAKHLILWSDCCGGQNRNIKIVVMLKAILNTHSKLKKISFRFLESGHTFLPNDTDFSKIETALKHHQRVYTAEEYMEIIRNARKRNPLQAYKMEKTDFYSTEIIEKNITNRKRFTDKTKVNWLQAKEIMIKKEEPWSIFMRTSFEENFSELNIKKNFKGNGLDIDKTDFIPLWPNGKPIAPVKLVDLQSLFQYIPIDCVQFYQQLNASDDIIDDVEGFGGRIDFTPDFEE